MTRSAHPRLENLLGSTSQGLADDLASAAGNATGLPDSGAAALLALQEFLGGANIGRLAAVLGLTHSGAVRLVMQLERGGLVERRTGTDRRNVEVRLTPRGRRQAGRARVARGAVLRQAVSDLDEGEAAELETLLERLITARVRARIERRAQGWTGAWWCRMCDFGACRRPDGRCPAAQTAAGAEPPADPEG